MRQVSTFRNSPTPGEPNLDRLRGVVADEVLDAARLASVELARLGIRHAIVGGLAVGAHGWPRATRDVDFLVGPEGFVKHGSIVTFRDGVPLRVGRIQVDPILYADGEEYLEDALQMPRPNDQTPIAPIEALIYMKLRAPRLKDATDIIELVKAGIDEPRVLAYLRRYAPDLPAKFQDLVKRARAEE